MEKINFSLTEKETKFYNDWIESIWANIELDEDEVHSLYPEFKFFPFEFGLRIVAKVGSKELLIRTADENDEVK